MKAHESTDPIGQRTIVAHPFETVDLFGLPFISADSEAALADHLARWVPSQRRADLIGDRFESSTVPVVFTPNVDVIVHMSGDDGIAWRDFMRRARFVLPDGWPIVSVSKLAGRPLDQRLAGSSIFAHWWPQIAADKRRVAMVISNDVIKAGLLAEHEAAVILRPGLVAPNQTAINDLADEFVRLAVPTAPEFIVFGLGLPKDPALASAVFDRWPDDLDLPLALCLGASAELYLGLRKRAPGWSQRLRLEWIVRFVQEPRRMFKRYFIQDLAFIPIALREVVRLRRS